MPDTQLRLHKIAFGALTSLCLAFTTFGQETEPNEPQQPKIIRKSSGALQESAINRIEPIYPPLAKAARISGSVVVEVTIDDEGGVISARAISGHPTLKDAAVTAAQEWRFSPTRLQGVPVKVIGTITFNFTFVDPMLIADLEAKVRENPSSAEAHHQLANVYKESGQTDQAILEYRETIRIKPDSANAYFDLGQTFDRLRRFDEAHEAYGLAMRHNIEFDSAGKPISKLPKRAHILIAQFHYRRGEYQQGLEVLKQTANLYTDLDEVHIYLGQMYLGLGDKQSALIEYGALKNKQTEFAESLLRQIEKQP